VVTVLILVVVALTSAAAWATTVRGVRPRMEGFLQALLRTVEGVGLAVMFLALNLFIGFLILRALWTVTGYFVSVYVLEDSALLMLSAFQGFAFRWWLDRASA
jgi:hypothetical protein